MWVRTEGDLLLNLDYVRAVKIEDDGEGGLRLVAYGDEAAYGGRAASVVIRHFAGGEGPMPEQLVEEAARALDLLQASLEAVHQVAVVTPSHPVPFRTI